MKISDVEWIFVVLIAMLVGLFATHRHLRERERSYQHICISNLRQISGGIDQWAIENNKVDTASAGSTDYLPYLKATPICPAAGTYASSTVAANPTCTLEGHRLP